VNPVIRAITLKYISRLRRTMDIENRTVVTMPTRQRLYLEMKDRDDLSQYSPQRMAAPANAGDEMDGD
jgi:hypothetical protein